jgi:hypothetical protein
MIPPAVWCDEHKSFENMAAGWSLPETFGDGDWHYWTTLDNATEEERKRFFSARGPIDQSTTNDFTMGWCDAFALALHEMTGWPVRWALCGNEEDEEDEDSPRDALDHAWCERPDGTVVDIRGVFPNGSHMVTRKNYVSVSVFSPLIDEYYRSVASRLGYLRALEAIRCYPSFFGIDETTIPCSSDCCTMRGCAGYC